MKVEFTEEQAAGMAARMSALRDAAVAAQPVIAAAMAEFNESARQLGAAAESALAEAAASARPLMEALAQASRVRVDVPAVRLSISANHATSSDRLPAVP